MAHIYIYIWYVNANIKFINVERLAGIVVGDELVIDGGMACFEVIEKIGNDLRCKCTDSGLFLPRAKLSFWREGVLVERNYGLPTLSAKVTFICIYPCVYFFFSKVINFVLLLCTIKSFLQVSVWTNCRYA